MPDTALSTGMVNLTDNGLCLHAAFNFVKKAENKQTHKYVLLKYASRMKQNKQGCISRGWGILLWTT